jgi:hypothetical protein
MQGEVRVVTYTVIPWCKVILQNLLVRYLNDKEGSILMSCSHTILKLPSDVFPQIITCAVLNLTLFINITTFLIRKRVCKAERTNGQRRGHLLTQVASSTTY